MTIWLEFIWTGIEIKNYKDEIIVIDIENTKKICDWKLKFWNLSKNIIWNWSQPCLA